MTKGSCDIVHAMASPYVNVSTFLYGLVISYNEYFIETNTTNSTGAPTDDQRTALLAAAAAAILFACFGVECSGDHSRTVHPALLFLRCWRTSCHHVSLLIHTIQKPQSKPTANPKQTPLAALQVTSQVTALFYYARFPPHLLRPPEVIEKCQLADPLSI